MNQHNPFLYVEIAWIMTMFSSSYFLLFTSFLYISFVVCFLFTIFVYYIISYFWFSFSFFVSISYYYCLTCIFLLYFFLLFLFSFCYFFSHIICFCSLLLFVSFSFPFFSWFLLVLLNIVQHYSLFTRQIGLRLIILIQLSKGNMWGFVLIVFVIFLLLCDSNIHSFLLQYPF